jgi:hypothetical protein
VTNRSSTVALKPVPISHRSRRKTVRRSQVFEFTDSLGGARRLREEAALGEPASGRR